MTNPVNIMKKLIYVIVAIVLTACNNDGNRRVSTPPHTKIMNLQLLTILHGAIASAYKSFHGLRMELAKMLS